MNNNITNKLSKNHPGTGDIRLRIETTEANQPFSLFSEIITEEGGFVSVDWGDGNKETFTGVKKYWPCHRYAKAGEYIVKLTGSKFTGVEGVGGSSYNAFQVAVREILSLKMPVDSTRVSLRYAFYRCTHLSGVIPAWDDCITNVNCAYEGCTGLTGNVPEWGANTTHASCTYWSCTGLTGRIPEWGTKIKVADFTYWGCNGLTGRIPEWGMNVTRACATYEGCVRLTGLIPAWGENITDVCGTYNSCIGLTGCSKELLQDPMPPKIVFSAGCVYGCVDEIRKRFTPSWGGIA